MTEKILECLGVGDVLCQLAEEAAELSQAALKLRRAYGLSNSKTPVSTEDAYENLLEEIADINVCISVLALDKLIPALKISETEKKKLQRWHNRVCKSSKDNACVVCGAIIPEGRQVCPNCQNKKG